MATRRVAMREKVGLIVNTVRRARRIEFTSLVAPWRERMHGVMTLLAGLELGRRRVVSLRQREHFSPLWFYRGRNLKDGSEGSVLGVALGSGEGAAGGVADGDGAETGAAGAGGGAA